MIVIGVILLIVGFVINFPIIWILGIIAVVAGLALMAAGALGHAVGGRRYWY